MAEANWYVVHTYSGYENKVKVDIEKTIENRSLQDQILEVSVPMQSVVEIKNGVEKAVDKKMFPGYVLIHMIMNDDTWYVVRNTRGVTGYGRRDPFDQRAQENRDDQRRDVRPRDAGRACVHRIEEDVTCNKWEGYPPTLPHYLGGA